LNYEVKLISLYKIYLSHKSLEGLDPTYIAEEKVCIHQLGNNRTKAMNAPRIQNKNTHDKKKGKHYINSNKKENSETNATKIFSFYCLSFIFDHKEGLVKSLSLFEWFDLALNKMSFLANKFMF